MEEYYNNLKRITRRSLKLLRTNMDTSSPISTIEQLFIDKVVKKVLSILSDNSHPLFHNYVQMRSERLRALPARTQRYRLSFVLNSIHVFYRLYIHTHIHTIEIFTYYGILVLLNTCIELGTNESLYRCVLAGRTRSLSDLICT